MTAVPAAAITAAQQADREFGRKNGGVWLAVGHLRLASILEAAAPHLDAISLGVAVDVQAGDDTTRVTDADATPGYRGGKTAGWVTLGVADQLRIAGDGDQ